MTENTKSNRDFKTESTSRTGSQNTTLFVVVKSRRVRLCKLMILNLNFTFCEHLTFPISFACYYAPFFYVS